MERSPAIYTPSRRGDMRDTLADRSLAEKLLGWTPRVSIEEGLAELLKR